MSRGTLDAPEILQLLTLVEEGSRSNADNVRFFVEPTEDALRRCSSKRHHIVFGRRGSGKSSLLRKAAADLTVDRRPIAWVDLESFKNHSYPDLLLSVLLATLTEFNRWLDTAATAPGNKSTFWKTLWGKKPTRPPFNRRDCSMLRASIEAEIAALTQLLHAPEDASVSTTQQSEVSSSSTNKLGGSIGAKAAGGQGLLSASHNEDSRRAHVATRELEFKEKKIDFLRRNIMKYQSLFDGMYRVSGGDAYLFLDDLYHIRRMDQPAVVDYFHSVGKGHHLWLKVGTIRHRSDWYKHGNPPIGVKLGDDAEEIDLDLTLEKYGITKAFLTKILDNFATSANVNLQDILTEGAIDRLVLASGGVARDFLSIFRRSVAIARERGNNARGPKVGAEDINVAAGEHDSTKREELKRDTYAEEGATLEEVFATICEFCLDKNQANSNCFLIRKDDIGTVVNAIHELVDMRLLHLIRSRVTINVRQGTIYEAYMLDLSQYAGARKKRELGIIEFWKDGAKDELRKVGLIFETSR